jgi:hypothetical protein
MGQATNYTNCTCPKYYVGYDGKKVKYTCPHMKIHLKFWFREK